MLQRMKNSIKKKTCLLRWQETCLSVKVSSWISKSRKVKWFHLECRKVVKNRKVGKNILFDFSLFDFLIFYQMLFHPEALQGSRRKVCKMNFEKPKSRKVKKSFFEFRKVEKWKSLFLNFEKSTSEKAEILMFLSVFLLTGYW